MFLPPSVIVGNAVYRGSRKHVLDWTARLTFPVELLHLVAPLPCTLAASSCWMPQGYQWPDEARLESFGPLALPGAADWPGFRSWWLAHKRGANTPNWDIAARCEIAGRPGLILVEAKANVPELNDVGKSKADTPSSKSADNSDRIKAAIDEACAALQRVAPTIALSRDSHYQLSNRIAFAWKLASLGIPTILVYLGFWGDDGIKDAGAPFDSPTHWEAVFAAHAGSVFPKEHFGVAIDCGSAPMWLLVRDRRVLGVSPPKPS